MPMYTRTTRSAVGMTLQDSDLVAHFNHTVTSGLGPSDPNAGVEFSRAATFTVGTTFSHTFNSAGDFDYFCAPHFTLGMTGVVRVGAAPAVPSMGVWAFLTTAMLMCGAAIWATSSQRRAQFVPSKD